MKAKILDKLPEEAKMIRTKVFMEEPGFQNEFDEKDSISTHIVLFDSLNPIATCRIYYSEKRKSYIIGRIAVLKAYRGKNIGSKLLNEAEKEILNRNGEAAELPAQVSAAVFYEKNGYASFGDIHMDVSCPHIWMKKELK